MNEEYGDLTQSERLIYERGIWELDQCLGQEPPQVTIERLAYRFGVPIERVREIVALRWVKGWHQQPSFSRLRD